ncbi:MAG: addiction module protein [Planctomycetota bacterium]
MTDKAKALLDEVLKLTAGERAALVAEVLSSLEHEEAEQESGTLSPAWRAEIERRAQRVLAGDAQGAPWQEVRARLERHRDPGYWRDRLPE